MERYLAQSPFDDGSLHERLAGPPPAPAAAPADAHDRVAVHEARAQEAIDDFDRRWAAAL